MAGLPTAYQELIRNFLAPLLAGTVVNTFLYGLAACLQWQYWHLYRRDQ